MEDMHMWMKHNSIKCFFFFIHCSVSSSLIIIGADLSKRKATGNDWNGDLKTLETLGTLETLE